jgi:hypothetical protein
MSGSLRPTLRDLRRRALEREASRILRADRRRQSTLPAHPLARRPRVIDAESEPAEPRRYTLGDLGKLRKMGRVP